MSANTTKMVPRSALVPRTQVRGQSNQRNNQPRVQQPFTQRMHIPRSTAQAVRAFDRQAMRVVRVAAYGGTFYSIAQALVLSDEGGTAMVVEVLAPRHPGCLRRGFALYREELINGLRYQIVTIHQSPHGVWFSVQDALGYSVNPTVAPPITNHFPVIGGHLHGDVQAGEQMLRQLSDWCGIELNLREKVIFREYLAVPLGQWEAQWEQLNAERREAMLALDQGTMQFADSNHRRIGNVCGYDPSLETGEILDSDTDRLAKVERIRVERTDTAEDLVEEVSHVSPQPAATLVRAAAAPAVKRPTFVPRRQWAA